MLEQSLDQKQKINKDPKPKKKKKDKKTTINSGSKKIEIDNNEILRYLQSEDAEQQPILKNLVYRARSGRKSAYIDPMVWLFNNKLKEIKKK